MSADLSREVLAPPEAIYTALVNVRNTEVTAYWARYNIQAVINFGLLAAILSARPEMPLLHRLAHALPAVGIVLGAVWAGFVVVSKWVLVRGWERVLAEYEERFLARDGARCLAVFSHFLAEEGRRSALARNVRNLNLLALLLPVACVLAWAWVGLQSW